MTGPVLYSTNPWFAHELALKYRDGRHFVWCSYFYDPTAPYAPAAAADIAPSSSPKRIYDRLYEDVSREDTHSTLIKGYRSTFTSLAKSWYSDGSLTAEQRDEIIATVRSKSWKIWRPVLYVIPSSVVAGRIIPVTLRRRAAYGPEMQIVDLMPHEFDMIER